MNLNSAITGAITIIKEHSMQSSLSLKRGEVNNSDNVSEKSF